MNPRLVGLSLAAVLIIAAASTAFGGAGTAYVDTDCSLPLEDNTVDRSDANTVRVWLRLDGVAVGSLHWHIYDKGVEQAGPLEFGAATGCVEGPYTQYYTDWNYSGEPNGSYTLKVHFDNPHANFSGDSFRIVP